MECQAVIPGMECNFWGKQGCTYPGAACRPVVDKCDGCERVVKSPTGAVCGVYPEPELKWQQGICNFSTHVKAQTKSEEARVNPLKASKKSAGKK